MRFQKTGSTRFNKKGSGILDVFVILGVLFVIGFVGIILYDIFGEINEDIQADDTMGNTSKASAQDIYDRFPTWLDGVFAFIIIGLWIISLILSFILPNDSVFLWITIVLLLALLIVAAIAGNVYEEWIASDEITGQELNFPIMNFILSHLVETLLVIAISITIVLFGKSRLAG